MTWKILNTLDLSGAPEAVATFEGVGDLVSLPPERKLVLDRVHEFHAYHASASLQIDKEFLEKAKSLRVIGSPSTGTDHMDVDEIKKRNIVCFDIAKEYELINSFSATSELAFGLLLSLVRKIPSSLTSAKNADWAREKYTGFQLLGKTFGILGLGRLGKISARIAKGFGMNVIAHDIHNVTSGGVEMVDFETLLRTSDVLSIHIHLTPNTDGLIGHKEFERMKPTSILINTSRGRIVDEKALLSALKNGQLAGACLDVIDGEWLPADELTDHPLLSYARDCENLLISPHIGGATKESIYGARVFMANKLAEWINSQPNKTFI